MQFVIRRILQVRVHLVQDEQIIMQYNLQLTELTFDQFKTVHDIESWNYLIENKVQYFDILVSVVCEILQQ